MEEKKNDNSTASETLGKANDTTSKTALALPVPPKNDAPIAPAKAPIPTSKPVASQAKPEPKPVAKKEAPKKAAAKPAPKKPEAKKPAAPVEPKAKEGIALANVKIPISKIILSERWNRDKAVRLKELIMSMRSKVGLINPIVVIPLEGGKFELVDGHQRYMAAKEIGWKDITASFANEDTRKNKHLASLVANVQREGHNPVELAKNYAALIEAGDKQKEVARACGVTEGSVSQHLKFMELPEKALTALQVGKVNTGQARQLCRLLSDDVPWSFFDKVFDKQMNGMSSSESEDMVSLFMHRAAEKAKSKAQKKKGVTAPAPAPAPAKEEKKSGRPIKSVDYTDSALKKKARVASKDRLFECLGYYAEKRNKAKSDVRRKYYEGYLAGLEIAAGLKDVDI